MTKKSITVFILAVLVSGVVFAQTTEKRKNAVSLDLGPLLLFVLTETWAAGGGYERALNDNFSLMLHSAIGYSPVTKLTGFDIDLHGRFYPQKEALAKLFFDVGVGYGFVGGDVPFATGTENLSSNMFTAMAFVGWKFAMDTGLFIEAAAGYAVTSGEKLTGKDGSVYANPNGGSVKISLGIGYAF